MSYRPWFGEDAYECALEDEGEPYEGNLFDDKELENLWKELEDVTLDEDERGILRLVNDWNGFSKGTDIEDVWYWFDEHHSKGVGYLMNEYEKE